MPSLFSESGQSSNIGISAPNLKGDFVPAVDNPNFTDNFGLVVPWGGGATSRNYLDYGTSPIGQLAEDNQFDLGNVFGGGGDGGTTYNVEGLIGPQGLAGPMGPQGAQGLPGTAFFPSNYITDYTDVLNDINTVWGDGATADTMLYNQSILVEWDITWVKLDIDSGVSAWNDVAFDYDGSAILIVADDGTYQSADGGSTWTDVSPGSEAFVRISIAASSGNAVLLGDTNREISKYWKSTDSGLNWSEVTIS